VQELVGQNADQHKVEANLLEKLWPTDLIPWSVGNFCV